MTLRTALTQRSIGFLGTAFLGVVVCAFFLTGAAALATNDAAPSLMVPLLPILCIVLGPQVPRCPSPPPSSSCLNCALG